MIYGRKLEVRIKQRRQNLFVLHGTLAQLQQYISIGYYVYYVQIFKPHNSVLLVAKRLKKHLRLLITLAYHCLPWCYLINITLIDRKSICRSMKWFIGIFKNNWICLVFLMGTGGRGDELKYKTKTG